MKNTLSIISGISGLIGIAICGYILGYTLKEEVSMAVNEHPLFAFGAGAIIFSVLSSLLSVFIPPKPAKES